MGQSKQTKHLGSALLRLERLDLDVGVGFSNEKQEHSNFHDKMLVAHTLPRLSYRRGPMRLLYAFSEELEK